MHTRRGVLRTFSSIVVGTVGIVNTTSTTATSDEHVTKIDADPESGYHYPFFLRTPSDPPTDEIPLMVAPNNTGTTSDDYDKHLESAREQAVHGSGEHLVRELEIPVLVPAFPRPREDPVHWSQNIHELNRETMLIDDGPLQRVDLQLVNMIQTAKETLVDDGHTVADRILLDGYSSSGNFSHRFAALHPEMVKCVTAGGVNGMPILPIDRDKGHTLNFQIGVADVEELTGEPFNLEAFTDTNFYFYMGADDDNDTLPNEDVWSSEQIDIAYSVYGDDMQQDRFPYVEEVYGEAGVPAEFRLYEGIGHETTSETWNDVIEFHRTHAGIPDTRASPDIIDLLDTVGIPVEAALGASVAVLGVLGYLMQRLDGDSNE